MRSELVIRRIGLKQFDVSDTTDRHLELKDISESQVLAFLKRKILVDTTPEKVMEQFRDRRSIVHVTIET
jgi:hypothetical protein